MKWYLIFSDEICMRVLVVVLVLFVLNHNGIKLLKSFGTIAGAKIWLSDGIKSVFASSVLLCPVMGGYKSFYFEYFA